jgi:hypothetical protein
MSWSNYLTLGTIPEKPDIIIKETYSVTSDILSFQLCPKQYGFFVIRKYQPAHVVQIWFGTIIHQVLDKLHLHYSGLLDPKTTGKIPSDEDVEFYFNEVEDSLRARGIKAINPDIREVALKIIKIFNRVEGPTLYPNVKDSECSLQADQGGYVIHGVVDVLKDVSIGKEIPNYESVEIWDYKGSKFPDTSTPSGLKKLERYTFQMLAYAELYKLKNGKYPLKGVLYFMNELNTIHEPISRPTQAIYEIDFRNPLNIKQIKEAIKSFSETAKEIERCRVQDSWEAPKDIPDKETCDICDLRWGCKKDRYPMRYP